MKLVVGLGNPGSKYQNTRHNIGFIVIDELLKKMGEKTKFDAKFNAEVTIARLGIEKVIIAKPATYMNLSGEAVLKIIKFYDIQIEDVLIVFDDINLETGKLRLRELGGHGGHNGIRNIIGLLKTEAIKRIRIGIDYNSNYALDQYVLGTFSKEETEKLQSAIHHSVEAIEQFVAKRPFKDIMTTYNTQT